MNSTSIKIKKFLSNRNTVTILCAIIGIVVLYVGYNLRVKSAIEPVKVPYAKVTIQPRTKIQDDMIGYMEVAKAALDEMGQNVILDKEKIINYYSNINSLIPQGSLFYNGAVIDGEKIPGASVYKVPEGQVLYYLTVNMTTSYVNSIVPGEYIDLYIRTTDKTTGQARVGKFIEKIEVFAVKTSDGLDVFENSEEVRVPAYIIFSIPKEQHTYLLMAAELGLPVIPVPINRTPDTKPGESVMTSEELKSYIDALGREFLQDAQNNLTENEETNGELENNTNGE